MPNTSLYFEEQKDLTKRFTFDDKVKMLTSSKNGIDFVLRTASRTTFEVIRSLAINKDVKILLAKWNNGNERFQFMGPPVIDNEFVSDDQIRIEIDLRNETIAVKLHEYDGWHGHRMYAEWVFKTNLKKDYKRVVAHHVDGALVCMLERVHSERKRQAYLAALNEIGDGLLQSLNTENAA